MGVGPRSGRHTPGQISVRYNCKRLVVFELKSKWRYNNPIVLLASVQVIWMLMRKYNIPKPYSKLKAGILVDNLDFLFHYT